MTQEIYDYYAGLSAKQYKLDPKKDAKVIKKLTKANLKIMKQWLSVVSPTNEKPFKNVALEIYKKSVKENWKMFIELI